MSLFTLIAQGVDVSGVNRELAAAPELWNRDTYRTENETSPHREVDDIWLRWRDPAELTTPDAHREPHWAVNWPAWHALPSLHPIVRNLSHVVDATARGGILITRTPAGGQVKPHVDDGWSARFFGTKLYLILQSNARCLIHCGDDVENCRAGDVVEYPNSIIHSVHNDGSTPHVNVIICFRTEPNHAISAKALGDAG